MGRERRRHPRYRVAMRAVLHVGGGGRALSCQAWDLSLQGIFLLLQQDVPVGTRVELALMDGGSGERAYYLAGLVVHMAAARGVGIRFSAQCTREGGPLAALVGELSRGTSQVGVGPRG
jgi:hypothetical protein